MVLEVQKELFVRENLIPVASRQSKECYTTENQCTIEELNVIIK
jgi:hypothetical protein